LLKLLLQQAPPLAHGARHGGYIDVDSEKGKGTTFSIYLPATGRKVKEEKVSSGGLLKGKGTALLVDDEDMVLDVGEQMLKKLGYEVLLAEGGREAIELYNKNLDDIDMVLLDMLRLFSAFARIPASKTAKFDTARLLRRKLQAKTLQSVTE